LTSNVNRSPTVSGVRPERDGLQPDPPLPRIQLAVARHEPEGDQA
jgi:hypothetical protein